MDEAVAQTQIYRSAIISYVYRITGSLEDAKDITQETILKYIHSNTQEIKSPKAWMFKVATNLSWDFLKSAQHKRESYIGPWLPEPYLEESFDVEEELELDESLSMALLVVMERLSPKEKSVYILHDIFDFSHKEVADIVNTSVQNSRQLSSRANKKLKIDKSSFTPSKDEHIQLTNSFLEAVKIGDFDNLKKIFSDEIKFHSDGGGKAVAFRKVLYKDSRYISEFFVNNVSKLILEENEGSRVETRWFNGSLGVIVVHKNCIVTAFSFEIRNTKISAVYALRNPDKLKLFVTA